MLATSQLLRGCGVHVVRFNFAYREKQARTPDPMVRLKQCYAAVVEHVCKAVTPGVLILGGRSMGGRVASMLAAESFKCNGLLLLAYPLHPAGQPDKRRDAHLERIAVPVLCINGTRDPLCRQDLMEKAVSRLSSRWTMHWLQDADHSFHVLKTSGRTDQEVLVEVGQAFEAWMARAP
jgi:predicted alpha/beta-hydrolase family hydrolase